MIWKALSGIYKDRISSKPDTFHEIRRQRLMQIGCVTALGLLAALTVAKSSTFTIIVIGLASLVVSFTLSYKHKLLAASLVLLGAMSSMLFALAITGAGIYDLAVLGFSGIIIFAAILGGVAVFLAVLAWIIALCLLMAWLTLSGHIVPNTPRLTWSHVVFLNIILMVIGLSVYILVQDIKRLLSSLKHEHKKVQQSRTRIQHLAHHDALTNLPNRRCGEKRFAQLLANCANTNKNLAILFIDLDNFKPVNDALGHESGDLLLQQLTHRITSNLSKEQYLIRFGGDEFLVLTQFEHKEELETLAKSLILHCASTFLIRKTRVRVSASIGIVQAPEHGINFKSLCRKADIAMYHAKTGGKNTFRHYDLALDAESEAKFTIMQRLKTAIAEDEFEVYYQPVIHLETSKLEVVEALLRWPQQDGSLISPEYFIPLAETAGIINDIGLWVMNEACLFCAKMRAEGFEHLRVAVNLSTLQFQDGKLPSIVEFALAQSDLPANALELEITESVLMDDVANIQHQLDALASLGVNIAIDDFGTGYSNLSYLHKFNAQTLKIDRSLVTQLGPTNENLPLVTAIISMAKSLHLNTVAEGIEHESTAAKLINLGCTRGQGFLWSKPLPPDTLSQQLKSHY